MASYFSVNCKWSKWSWESCTKSCGGGISSGTRTILLEAANGGASCSGSNQTSKPCNTESCPGATPLIFSQKSRNFHTSSPQFKEPMCPEGHSCTSICPEIEELKNSALFTRNALVEQLIEVFLQHFSLNQERK